MRRLLAFVVLVLISLAAPARAAVTVTFYSHDLEMFRGLTTYYPHGFIVLSGTDAAGAAVDASYGFSATSFYPNVLWQPVRGVVETALPEGYLGRSTRHFALVLSEEYYRAVLAVVEKWQTWPQPSYDIDTHNCVHFVKELAAAAGLAVSDDRKFNREPKDFLSDVTTRNAALLSGQVPSPAALPVASQAPAQLSPGPDALKERVQQLERERARSQ